MPKNTDNNAPKHVQRNLSLVAMAGHLGMLNQNYPGTSLDRPESYPGEYPQAIQKIYLEKGGAASITLDLHADFMKYCVRAYELILNIKRNPRVFSRNTDESVYFFVEQYFRYFMHLDKELKGVGATPHPDARALFEVCQEVMAQQPEDGTLCQHIAKAFYLRIRNDEHHKQEVGKFERTAQKNAKAIRTRLAWLQKQHANLKIARFELSFGFKFYSNGEKLTDREHITEKAAKSHLDRWLKKIKHEYGEKVVSSIWKLEQVLEIGPRFHVVLFLDGKIDPKFSSHIVQIWTEVTNKNHGVIYAAKPASGSHRGQCVGFKELASDDFKRESEYLINYLTKMDRLVKVKFPLSAGDAIHNKFCISRQPKSKVKI